MADLTWTPEELAVIASIVEECLTSGAKKIEAEDAVSLFLHGIEEDRKAA